MIRLNINIIIELQITYNFLKTGAKWASTFYKIYLISKKGTNLQLKFFNTIIYYRRVINRL